MKILVIGDNRYITERLAQIIHESSHSLESFDFTTSSSGYKVQLENQLLQVNEIDLFSDPGRLTRPYDLVISAHCLKILPAEIVNQVRCVNIHPGYLPFNRGMFPHVFSIMNKHPTGVTIHEMDEKIDHGGIIDQVEVEVLSHDTSGSLYSRLLEVEIELIAKNLDAVITGNYKTYSPELPGNINTLKDFQRICELNLNDQITLGGAIDLLRALSHSDYQNAYFLDSEGHKVYLSLELKRE